MKKAQPQTREHLNLFTEFPNLLKLLALHFWVSKITKYHRTHLFFGWGGRKRSFHPGFKLSKVNLIWADSKQKTSLTHSIYTFKCSGFLFFPPSQTVLSKGPFTGMFPNMNSSSSSASCTSTTLRGKQNKEVCSRRKSFLASLNIFTSYTEEE